MSESDDHIALRRTRLEHLLRSARQTPGDSGDKLARLIESQLADLAQPPPAPIEPTFTDAPISPEASSVPPAAPPEPATGPANPLSDSTF